MSDQENNQQKYGKELAKWTVPEFNNHERQSEWFWGTGFLGIVFLGYCVYTANFLFAVILIIVAFIIITHHGKTPRGIDFVILEEGLMLNGKFYDYDEIKNFSVVSKDYYNVNNVYFEFKNFFEPRWSIPLDGQDPLLIRKILLKYLSEDLERTDAPLSERFGKWLKI